MGPKKESTLIAAQGVLFGAAADSETPHPGEPWRPGSADRGQARPERPHQAKRSLLYMANAALAYGRVKDLDDLIHRVVALRQHRPFNAFLILLQRPAATYVLPAHEWDEVYGRVVRPDQQPLVLLQPHGPVMFLFDVSQVEAGPRARALPSELHNPYKMSNWASADSALASIIDNAKQDGVRVTNQGLGLPYAGYISISSAGAQQGIVLRSRPKHVVAVPVAYDVRLNDAYSSTELLASIFRRAAA